MEIYFPHSPVQASLWSDTGWVCRTLGFSLGPAEIGMVGRYGLCDKVIVLIVLKYDLDKELGLTSCIQL